MCHLPSLRLWLFANSDMMMGDDIDSTPVEVAVVVVVGMVVWEGVGSSSKKVVSLKSQSVK